MMKEKGKGDIMDHIFEQYGKIIASVIGIIIAVAMIATTGTIIKSTLNDGVTKMSETAKTEWSI